MTVAELQGSIESHVSRILEKTEKENEEALKSQVNFTNVAKSSQSEDSSEEVEVVAISKEEVIIISINNGETTISDHLIKEEVDTISDLPIVEEEQETTPKKETTNFNCYHCGKFGHIAANCRFKQQANIAENQYQHTSESSDNPQTLLLATDNFAGDGDIWYLDTGCSNHMCGKKELFSSLNETVKSTVKFGNNTNIPILGKGRIAIKLKDGSQNFISDVLSQSRTRSNLFKPAHAKL
ncbi:hypothetical protein CR513_47338, partial [Mucuna pruriens]